MIILHMLNNLHKYGIFSSSKNQYQLLLRQNNQLIKEIKEMKSQIDNESYIAANNLYRKIIKDVNIRLFRILLREQYYGYHEDYLDVNFLYEYDDNNINNITFFRQIIFNKKIRNIVKHAVLKKFLKFGDNPDVVFKLLIDFLEKLTFPGNPAKETLRCDIIKGLLERKKDFIEMAKGILVGGNNMLNGGSEDVLRGEDDQLRGGSEDELRGEDDMLRGYDNMLRGEDDDMLRGEDDDMLIGGNEDELRGEDDDMLIGGNENELRGGASDNTVFLNSLFVFCALEFYDQIPLKDLCKRCIVLVNKDESERVIDKMERIINDTNIAPDRKSIYFVVVVDPKIDETKINNFVTVLLPNNVLRKKQNLFKSVITKDMSSFKKEIQDVICESDGVNADDLLNLIKNNSLQYIIDWLRNRASINLNPLKLNGRFIDPAELPIIQNFLQHFRNSLKDHTIVEIVNGNQTIIRVIFGTYIEDTLDLGRRIFKLEAGAEHHIKGIFPNLSEYIKLFYESKDFKLATDCDPIKIQVCDSANSKTFEGDLTVKSGVYQAFETPQINRCSGELGWYENGNSRMSFVKIYYINNNHYQFVDQECPIESKRSSDHLNLQTGGAYYKKYLKYKNKYLQSYLKNI